MEKDSKDNRICSEFINHLRDEKLNQQNFRASYIRLKFTFVIGLFSISSVLVRVDPINGMYHAIGLLFLAPLVTVLLDFYILGGELAVKRIRVFLNNQDENVQSERAWDKFLSEHPKRFMRLNRLWTTNFIFLVSIISVATILSDNDPAPEKWVLFSFWCFLIIGLGVHLIKIEDKIKELESSRFKATNDKG